MRPGGWKSSVPAAVSIDTLRRSPLVRHFSKLEDPRRDQKKTKHKLIDVIVIAVCASLCGIDEFECMAVRAKAKEAWLRQFLELPNGIPSHDTINRIFAKINPKLFQACFLDWIKDVAELCGGTVVAIDGKTLRRSFDRASENLLFIWYRLGQRLPNQLHLSAKDLPGGRL